MPPVNTLRHPDRRFTAVALLVILAMLLAGAVVFVLRDTAGTPTAAAAPVKAHKLTKGSHAHGYVIGGEWFGTWKTPDGTGFCIEFDKDHPNSSGAAPLPGRVPGMSAEESARVKYVANHYGRTTSKVDAAAAAIYVWKTQRTKRFDTFYAKLVKKGKISAAIRARVTQISAEAANHGPYKLSMTMGSGVVGQSVTGAVTVKAQNGKVVSGRSVVLTAKTNATLVKQDKLSNTKGRVGFTVKVSKVGSVRVDAKLVTPAAGGVWITRPSSGHQRLVLAGTATESAVATVATLRSVNGPSLSSACSADCAGAAPVTVQASNPCGAATLREIVYVNGTALAGGTVDVPACQTVKKSFTIADGAAVTSRFCYLDGAGTCMAAPVANAGALSVECPALPAYRFSATCPCGGDRAITYEVQVPAGSRRSYTATLTVKSANGSTWTRSAALATGGGWQALPTAALADGSTATLTVTVLGKTRTLDRLTEAG